MTVRDVTMDRLARLVGALCLGMGLLAGALAPASAETLKLGNEGTYPPFSMVDSSGKLTGFEPDLAREMCKRMNVECEFVVMDFKALIPSLLQGKFDVLVSQVTPTPERRDKMLFTSRLVANPMTFVVPAASDYEFTREGLKGKGIKVGLQRGGAHIKYLQDRVGDAIEYAYYDNPDQSRLDLLAGRINTLFEAKINVEMELISKPEGKAWKIAGGDHWIGDPSAPASERGLSWGIRKGEDALLKRVNDTLTAMLADCTYTRIRKAYLHFGTLPEDEACAAKVN
jgi:ABC-type amino acid transport substrate-binding protein